MAKGGARQRDRLPPFVFTLLLLGLVAVPAALTLHTARTPVLRGPPPANGSPHGYTVSLLLFLVPSLAIAGWLLPQERLHLSRRSCAWTLGLLVPLGCALDFFLARFFFVFPRPEATLGILAPALGSPVPVEEYLFYLLGFTTVLLFYIWLDEGWLALYSVPVEQRMTFGQLIGFHPISAGLGAVLVVLALALHRTGSFPGYFLFLVCLVFVPSTALLPAAKPVVNWRALSLVIFVLLLVSLLWEVTLALPYGWWGFRGAQMLGWYITAWAGLPVEEVYVWVAVSYTTAIVYEIVRRWKSSGRSARHALLGR